MTDRGESKPERGEYWYRFHHGECPLCGRDGSFKERVYGPRPVDHSERHIEETMYCGCNP